ncbi:hypothetical protein TRIATDRAFT_297607 [Trichoderma atroviride IMI 206040]|uniref:Uncharacterized protein n=1 Tax=Hypocrea atroviridis (strain ATCC 20476 / IMI 206040) TaxID=452589 RepID=G9NIV4_HYPAI|nr:uncharacterized protein TRIATDRAFT_297607 [Trichoderma atroviride IMI 206040]EHK49713.1 hypothetical protein TRIATDRAFT_297607 [Trichoderma atroviride IMI 206040]
MRKREWKKTLRGVFRRSLKTRLRDRDARNGLYGGGAEGIRRRGEGKKRSSGSGNSSGRNNESVGRQQYGDGGWNWVRRKRVA